MMNILVTGAGGMVGSHMVEYLYGRGDDVLGTYYKPTVDLTELNPNIKLLECDVRYSARVESIITKQRPRQIFHLAAQSFPAVSWERPEETVDINIKGTIAVFEAIKTVRRFFDSQYDPMVVVACSSAEYGQSFNELNGDEIFVNENAPLKPLHPYGVSKVGQDLLSFQYFMNDHIRCIRARIFNSTGTRKINDVTSDFTKRAVEAERSGLYSIRAGNLHTRRTILDQRDLVRALTLLADKGKAGEVYNISSEYIYQMSDIVKMIEVQIGHTFDTVVDEKLLRPTDERVIAGDVTRLKKDTDWKQIIFLEDTIKDMIEYWRMRG